MQHYNSVVLDDNPKFRRLVATRRVFCQHLQAVSVPVVLTVVTEHDQLTIDHSPYKACFQLEITHQTASMVA
ncbi:Uncharacterised protein [Acinetobacter baumannii]|nr:Uncharacterised protein [Acinetobacter baumannii]